MTTPYGILLHSVTVVVSFLIPYYDTTKGQLFILTHVLHHLSSNYGVLLWITYYMMSHTSELAVPIRVHFNEYQA